LDQVVIPDLLRKQAALLQRVGHTHELSRHDLTRLARAAVLHAHTIETELDTLLVQGWSMERVYLDVIAGIARLLGEWWIADQLDFASLTLATERLQDVVRQWESRFLGSSPNLAGADQYQVMLVSEFNDQHSLGMLMLQSFFKRDGWRVHNTWGMNEDDLLTRVAAINLHLVGLSICTDRRLPQTRQLISALRQRSMNPQLQIMVGGPLVLAHPNLVKDLGADWLSGHANQASREALEYVSQTNPNRSTV
jgi:methanogenic corrinoid protein MtbC1